MGSRDIRYDLYCGVVYGLGLSTLIWSLVLSATSPESRPLAFVLLGSLAGAWRVRLPRLGSRSLIYPFALATLLLYGVGYAVAAAALASALGWILRSRRRRASAPRHAVFGLGRQAIAACIPGLIYLELGGRTGATPGLADLLPLGAHVLGFVIVDLGLRLGARAALRGRRAGLYRELRTALAAVVAASGGAAVAFVLVHLHHDQALRLYLLVGPLTYMAYLIRRARTDRMQRLHRSRERTWIVHRSLTRALSQAIAADQGTSDEHQWRLQLLCQSLAERLGLDDDQIEHLASAALLHDIGRIGILDPSWAGRTDGAELQRIRVHPSLGADMLDAMSFPDEVKTIVRHQRERWDGRGYPDRLRGESIPLGSRILAVADAFDTNHLPRPGAGRVDGKALLRRESGRRFDPVVIDVLFDHLEEAGEWINLERRRGDVDRRNTAAPQKIFGGLADAPRNLRALDDIARAAGQAPMRLEQCMILIARALNVLVPHASLLLYLTDAAGRELHAVFAAGQAQRELRGLRIPAGGNVSGTAVRLQRALIHSGDVNPQVNSAFFRTGQRAEGEDGGSITHGDLDDLAVGETTGLTSAVAAPLVAGEACLGSLTLYDAGGRGFSEVDRHYLVAVAGYVARAVQRAGERRGPGAASLTDPLTGLPNASFLRLELSQRTRDDSPKVGFGLLAFRVGRLSYLGERWGGVTSERALSQIGRRLATRCMRDETLVRYGHDLFVVLTPTPHSGELVARFDALLRGVEEEPLDLEREAARETRLTAAHASYPDDAADAETLLEVLDRRLALSGEHARTVVPFRAPARAS